MRLTAILLCVAALSVSAKSVSQTITFSGKNVPVREVFSMIEQQTGYSVIGDRKVISQLGRFSASVTEMPLETFLGLIIPVQQFEYKISNRIVSVTPRRSAFVEAMAPAPPVIGIVRGPDGEPISGANVIIKQSGRGTSTDATGAFRIDAKEGEVLVVSSIGFATREITVGSSNEIGTITLGRANNKLDEVQIIAYGQVTKKFLTSNIGNISGAQIARQPVTNPLLALQGRVPGIYIEQTSGNTMANVNVVIQGQNSLRSGTAPFYVIDGIPYSPNFTNETLAGQNFPAIAGGGGGSSFNLINPGDIESVEILKDADATAIYGSRAANGAILITTKKGKAGRTKIDINSQAGVGKITRRAKLLNTSQYLEMRREAYMNDGLSVPDATTAPAGSNFDLTIWDPNKNHDWQEELVGGTAQFTNLQANVSGGSANTQFLAGAGFNKQTTVYPGNLSDKKFNVHLNVNHQSENKRFRINLNTSFLRDNNTLNNEDLMGKAVSLAPNAPDVFNPDGTLNWGLYSTNPVAYSFGNNPMAVIATNRYSGLTNNLLGNALVSYDLAENLIIKTTFGYNAIDGDETVFVPIEGIRPNAPVRQASAKFLDKSVNSYIIEPQLTYTKNIGLNYFDFLLGSTFQESKTSVSGFEATGFANNTQLSNIGAATNIIYPRSSQLLYKYNALFARINYRLSDKYLVNVTARRDGSSRFGTNNKFNNFYAVGAAWLFADERFMESASFLSTGKLRISYGTTGNDQIGDYAYESLLDNAPYGMPYQDLMGITPVRHTNPNLEWEETRKFNLGLNLGLFNDRIIITADYFRNTSSNQLIEYKLPGMTGFVSVSSNFPATIRNTGVELAISTTLIRTNRLRWEVSANATIPRNKLVYFQDFENSTYTQDYIVGMPVNIRRVYQYAGVDPNTGTYTFTAANGDITGFPNYEADRTGLFNPNPKWYGGLSTGLSYKKFELDILFQYVNKEAENYNFLSPAGTIHRNIPVGLFENRWQQKGDMATVEKFSTYFSLPALFAGGSDAKYSDASFLRLKNVSLSYTIPTRIVRQATLQNIRLFIQAQNLLTFTNYVGIDPESAIFGSLPPLKMFTAGLQLTF